MATIFIMIKTETSGLLAARRKSSTVSNKVMMRTSAAKTIKNHPKKVRIIYFENVKGICTVIFTSLDALVFPLFYQIPSTGDRGKLGSAI